MEDEVPPDIAPLPRRCFVAEALGVATLCFVTLVGVPAVHHTIAGKLAAQVASGGLLAAVTIMLCLVLGRVSGAHLNPLVSWANAAYETVSTDDFARLVVVQFLGAAIGGIAAGVAGANPGAFADRMDVGLVGEALTAAGVVIAGVVAMRLTPRARGLPSALVLFVATSTLGATSLGNPAIALGAAFADLVHGVIGSIGYVLAAQTLAAVIVVPAAMAWEDFGSAADPQP